MWREERQVGPLSRGPGSKGGSLETTWEERLVLAEERGGEQRIHSKAQARLRVPQGGTPRSSSEWAREGTKC